MSAAGIFWSAVGVVAYTYAGYPLLIAGMARLHPAARREPDATEQTPRVSVVMSAYNEAARLPAKLRNLRELAYPRDRLAIVVVSDGSTDGTERVAQGEPGVHVVVSRQRRGKAHALNLAMREVHGDIVVFCDLRQELDAVAVRRLVDELRDPSVGVASGELMHRPGATATGRSIGLYWRYEKWIRKSESRLYSTVGATGALYAMRRADWRDLREGTILDDFENPMQVVRRGKRAVLASQALAWDTLQEDSAIEKRRKIRTLSGNFQSFAANPWLFSPLANPVWFQFVSHKVLRLLVPYALLVALAASLAASGWMYRAAFALQALFYLMAGAGRWIPSSRRSRLVSFAHVFVDMNLAAVLALLRFAGGDADAKWEKTS